MYLLGFNWTAATRWRLQTLHMDRQLVFRNLKTKAPLDHRGPVVSVTLIEAVSSHR